MYRMLFALLLSLGIVLVSAPRVIPMLRKMKFGQTIYSLAPEKHKSKQGTPTMGGLMIMAGTVVGALVCHPTQWQGGYDFLLAAVVTALLSMSVGFADDYVKVAKKRSLGLTGWQKIAGQVFVALAFTLYCYFHPAVGSSVVVPFVNVEWDLGICYIPLMFLTVIFMINSANLQDGLDGLMSTVTMTGSMGWAAVAVLLSVGAADSALSANYYGLAVFALALAGGCMGFLQHNQYPAKVFMGDTGSMFIGGATVAVAMLMRQPLLLLLISFTMVMSSVSVIMQRGYYKLTHGKRIFKMSPIHHHFELCGMSETQIDNMYAVVTAVLSVAAVASVYHFIR